jgi:hypothetical protein
MTLEIPKQQWKRFLDGLSKRRFDWRTKIEVMNDSIGSQILSEGLPLVGVTAEERHDGGIVVEIALGATAADGHQTHSIVNPTKIAFLSEDTGEGEILEIEEANGTKTLVQIIEPAPLVVDYSELEVIAAEF